MNKDILYIGFKLWKTIISPHDIKNITGVDPDYSKLKGERNSKLILPKENLWTIESKVTSDEVPDHWEYLEKIIVPAQEKFKEIIELGGEATLVIVITSHFRIPPVFIPPSMCEFAAYINATIEIDHLQP
jgi:hypothetical protein